MQSVVMSTEDHPLRHIICPIISIDRLSEDWTEVPDDRILAIGDQALLYEHVVLRKSPIATLLSDPIDEPDVLGPLFDHFYRSLSELSSSNASCEVLLYLSGHGLDPGNICLLPDAMRPHPARNDLRDDLQYRYNQDEEGYLDEFYKACARANDDKLAVSSTPLGFVGGEVAIHQRGYIGVLGVLGLWCFAHRNPPKMRTSHHLVIVADTCFAGIWGNTLKTIANSETDFYRDLLKEYPVSIQCATTEFEASHGCLFTPLWIFLNSASESVKSHRDEFKFRVNEDPVAVETQHPWYFSTSKPESSHSWEVFEDADFFLFLHEKQLQLIKEHEGEIRRLFGVEEYRAEMQASFHPLVRSYAHALVRVDTKLKGDLEKEKRKRRLCTDSNVKSIELSRRRLRSFEFEAMRNSTLLLDGNKLKESNRRKLQDLLKCRGLDVPDIKSGVYVFQGGEGDMSLIVTPNQAEVILIDGTKTAACFLAAWDSTL